MAEAFVRDWGPTDTERCSECDEPMLGWIATSDGQVVYCRDCESFDEALATLHELVPVVNRERRKLMKALAHLKTV